MRGIETDAWAGGCLGRVRQRGLFALSLAVLFVVLQTGAVSGGIPSDLGVAAFSSSQQSDCEPHPPIRIDGDEGRFGFVSGYDPVTGEPVYRPGSGVRSGDGTPEDPFVIEGWCILVPAGAALSQRAVALSVASTMAHVVVRDNAFLGLDLLNPVLNGEGIVLHNTSNMTVRDNLFGSLHHDLVADGATGLVVAGNTVHGTHVPAFVISGSSGAIIEGNVMRAEMGSIGIHSLRSDDVAIVNNTVEGFSRGISLEGSFDNRVQGNQVDKSGLEGVFVVAGGGHRVTQNGFMNNNWAVYVESSVGGVVDNNTVPSDHSVKGSGGIFIRDSSGWRVVGNDLEGTREGVVLRFTENVSIVGNRIEATLRSGIDLADADGNRIEGNRLEEVGAGIKLLRASQNHLAANYVTGSGTDGLFISDSENNTVRMNAFKKSTQDGAFIQNAHGNIVEGNILSQSGWSGVFLTDTASGNVFHGNNIEHNGAYGLENWGGGTVEARNNWWGCEGGPGSDSPECNGILGNAHVDPWLEAANPDAGPPGQ